MKKTFYENGIQFQCQGSANCCVSRGSYGYVYLSKKDLTRLSKFFNKSVKKFKNLYCHNSEGYFHLKEIYKNGNCIFLKNKKCTVYTSRPSQCRTWPFWKDNMNVKVWNQDISINCPGIGKGKVIKRKEIDKFLKEDLINEKSILKNRINPQK